MRAKTLVILALIAAAAILGAALLERGSAPEPSLSDGGMLYPGLADNLNAVERLELDGPEEDQLVTLERTESGWIVVEKAGYPADAGKIRQLLLRLSEASIAETKTANPDLYSRLGVSDPGASEGSGTLLAIGPPADIRLIVGNRDSRAGGTYVRREGEGQSYLVDADIGPERDPVDWVERKIFDIDSALIREVRVTHADGEILRLMRVGDQMVAVGVPEGRELSSPGAPRPMTRLLSPLLVDDVAPMEGFDDEPAATIDFHLDDGRRITARAWHREDARWIAFHVGLDPAPEQPTVPAPAQEPPATGSQPEAPDEAPAGDAAPLERADPQDVARDDAALAGWVFQIPAYKYDQVVRRMEDLLNPVDG